MLHRVKLLKLCEPTRLDVSFSSLTRFADCAKQPNIYIAPMGVKDGLMATDTERNRRLSAREFSVVYVLRLI